MPTLKKRYKIEIVPALLKRFGYKNPMQVPKFEKVVINVGVGEAIQNIKLLDAAIREVTSISGQRPIVTKARKSIAQFKVRAGMPIGCMVTLRKDRMYHFLDRLINVALPRVRDFKGVSPDSFDGRGNYTLGLREQLIFPEIDYDKVEKASGMNVSIVTTGGTDEEAKELLRLVGMPFRS